MGQSACYVYVIGSAENKRYRTYVGWTSDLEHRLRTHNMGKGARSTKGRKWILLYAERHPDRRAAMSREWYLKRERKFRRELALVGW